MRCHFYYFAGLVSGCSLGWTACTIASMTFDRLALLVVVLGLIVALAASVVALIVLFLRR